MIHQFDKAGVRFFLKLKQDAGGCPKCPFKDGGLCAAAPNDCMDNERSRYKIVAVKVLHAE